MRLSLVIVAFGSNEEADEDVAVVVVDMRVTYEQEAINKYSCTTRDILQISGEFWILADFSNSLEREVKREVKEIKDHTCASLGIGCPRRGCAAASSSDERNETFF